MATFTMAEAKRDFERGLLSGAAIYFHETDVLGGFAYTVSFEAALAGVGGGGELVDARSAQPRRFKTMDAAHAAIRQVGFRPARFWVSSK